jgi:DNA-binding Xre family transcriptional regulator
MGISYNPLWKLLIDRRMKKTDLMNLAKLSPPTLAKLSKNEQVNTQTLEKICSALACQPGDIMEYVKEGGDK